MSGAASAPEAQVETAGAAHLRWAASIAAAIGREVDAGAIGMARRSVEDIEACVRRGLDGLPAQEAAFCGEADLDACVAAIQRQGCPPFDDWTRAPLDSRKLPEPCPRCSPAGPALLSDGGADAP